METIALPLINTLIIKLGSAVWDELRLGWGVKEDINKLQSLLSRIRAVLTDAEKRSIDEDTLRKWLTDLKDVAYDADDLLDEFQTDVLRRRMNSRTPEKVSFLLSYPKSIFMAHKIQDIVKKFNELADEKNKFGLAERYIPVSHPDRETSSNITENEIFGRENDKKAVLEWLMDDDNEDDLTILPIVGLGGLGKTTLAQLAYNDEKVTNHFGVKKWVCVRETFDVKQIVRAIITMREDISTLEKMQNVLRKEFGNKKYLLVLDDVWNDDELKWDRLKSLLRGSVHGSKIIVTTRDLRVAKIMGTVTNPIKLEVLSDDNCWKLFKQRAFGPGRIEETPSLVNIGLELVKKCGGLPLAAKSIGSLMATKEGEDEWLAVKNSEIWMIENSPEGIVPALRVSFDHLPPQLKQCFAYCSMFPKDFRMSKLKLIQLWIAGGFIEPEEDQCLEDIGERYFNILLWRSFFQEEEKDEFGKIESFKMHDLIHDLGCFVAKDWNSHRGCRHISLIGGSSESIRKVANEARKLRSLFLFKGEEYGEGFDAEDLEFAISKLPCLRALYLNSILEGNVFSKLGELKHLRFLDLSDNGSLVSLPDTVTNLYNLQTLILKDCWKLKNLPKGMKKLSNLRRLDLTGCESSISMPSGLGRLTNLQTLPVFVVGNGNEPGQLSIVELQGLKQIRGLLKIYGLGNIRAPEDAMKAELVTIKGVQSLKLYFTKHEKSERPQFRRWLPCGYNEHVGDDDLIVDTLENLQPPRNLKCLKIQDYDGSRLPNWLIKMEPSAPTLPHLVELELTLLSRCESLPLLGQLLWLKKLSLYSNLRMKKIGAELYGGDTTAATFPSLKHLILYGMNELEEWSIPKSKSKSKGEMFPALETLSISNCPKLRIQPSLPSSILELVIERSNEELLAAGEEGGCLQGLSSLRKLVIWKMEASKTGLKGLQFLTNLQELSIGYCPNLEWLPEGIMPHHFPSLNSLKLEYCHKLAMLPDGFQLFTALNQLTILILETGCRKYVEEDWHKISHIPNITIENRYLGSVYRRHEGKEI